jgi:hypothetical protein
VKALIIILALVGVSFIGLLIYGEGRSQGPKKACQKLDRGSDGNYDVPEDWCPPGIARATRPLQLRFGPGLDLPDPGKVVISVNPQQDTPYPVVPIADTDKHRAAKLTLISGNWAIVEGPGKAKQCLCKPKELMPAQLQGNSCGHQWQEDHASAGGLCQSSDKRGSIPIEWMGGKLTFKAGPAAQVEVK